MDDQSEESTASIEQGERHQVTISRISGRRNAITEVNGAELNLGPLVCPPGTEVEIMTINNEFAVCLNHEVWAGNYRISFRNFLDRGLPEPLPTPETHSQQSSDEIGTNGESESSTITTVIQHSEDREPDLDELRQKADQEARRNPSTPTYSVQDVQEYTRSDAVKQYVKVRSDGMCEGCDNPAPFKNSKGEPYLHAHHVHELSKGGLDTPETVIALCPNCHYRVHHGEDGDEYNEHLIEQLAEIEEKSIDEIQF